MALHALRFGMFVSVLAVAGLAIAQEPNPVPLVRAHAHNDYVHGRPLLDALDHGFCSIEVDVFEQDGTLLVAHNLRDVRSEKTLQA